MGFNPGRRKLDVVDGDLVDRAIEKGNAGPPVTNAPMNMAVVVLANVWAETRSVTFVPSL